MGREGNEWCIVMRGTRSLALGLRRSDERERSRRTGEREKHNCERQDKGAL